MSSASTTSKPNELVWTVQAAILPPAREALLAHSPALFTLLDSAGEFRRRGDAEDDEQRRQVIPYALVRHGGRTLLVRRTRAGGDARLFDRASIGLGGHINPPDAERGTGLVLAGLRRELHEEVSGGLRFTRPVGFLLSNAGPVERVHVGVVFAAFAMTEPRVKETEMLEGRLASLVELQAVRPGMEAWSALLLDWLAVHDAELTLEEEGLENA